jgi:hypothetical protein
MEKYTEDLDKLQVDEQTRAWMEWHAAMVRSSETPAQGKWSLAQPSPYPLVPSITTDCTTVDPRR